METKKANNLNEYFSDNGRITALPFRTDSHSSGNDQITIKFYKIKCLMTYSIQAQIQKRIYCKWPHPQDGLFETVYDCKISARNDLKAWCDQNKLKKAFNRLVPELTDQLDLFDDIL